MAHGRAGPPRGNQNRKGKGVKEKKAIPVRMSISDHADRGNGVYDNLRGRFEEYLINQGVVPTDDAIRAQATEWAYEAWWHRLAREEDERAVIL